LTELLPGFSLHDRQTFRRYVNAVAGCLPFPTRCPGRDSPLSAPRTPVDTLQDAVARLGANQIGDLVTSIAVARVFVPASPGQRELWLHAVDVAYACRAISEATQPKGVSAEHAYLSLLHDIARFIVFD
jgi:HD-like signal output (HDOD) protein